MEQSGCVFVVRVVVRSSGSSTERRMFDYYVWSSGHETGEVFDKGIMLGFFVSQKQKVDGIFTVSYTHLTLPTKRIV